MGGLADVFAHYQLGFQLVVELVVAQHLLGEAAVGRVGRVGNGEVLYLRVKQGF